MGRVIRTATMWLRDSLAGLLASTGVSPNALTWAGLFLGVGAAGALMAGAGHAPPWESAASRSWWPLLVALLLFLTGAMDVLDGNLARLTGRSSSAGAFLDSTLDRAVDFLLCLGCAVHFALSGNVTYVALSMFAMASSFLISYTKARADNFVVSDGVGYWQRPERFAAFLVAASVGHVPAALWLLGVAPWWTVWNRLRYAERLIAGDEASRATRWIRTSLPYDLVTAANVLFLAVAPFVHDVFSGRTDPLRRLLTGLLAQ